MRSRQFEEHSVTRATRGTSNRRYEPPSAKVADFVNEDVFVSFEDGGDKSWGESFLWNIIKCAPKTDFLLSMMATH